MTRLLLLAAKRLDLRCCASCRSFLDPDRWSRRQHHL